MDLVERLTLEAARADTMIAREHRHRYEFAAGLLGGRRVLDLCCGSGYGTAILAAAAAHVTGVDRDLATIDGARAHLGRHHDNVDFLAAEAVALLEDLPASGGGAGGDADARQDFEAIVCFEGLEHLQNADRALELLRAAAGRGMRILASLPNDRMTGAHNAFHTTRYGYEEALAAFAGFPGVVMVPQFLAEGSLLSPPGARELAFAVVLGDRYEPEYANHFVFCVGFGPEEVAAAQHGRMALSASPLFNRWSEEIKRGAEALRRENARLARGWLGKAGSGAATALAQIEVRETRIRDLEAQLRRAEVRADAALGERSPQRVGSEGGAGSEGDAGGTNPGEGREASGVSALGDSGQGTAGSSAALSVPRLPDPPDGDANSWEWRRRRAAEVLIPWIEQTVSLEGKTVLEYGCGNGAVSAAFASRAGRLIGVDIDASGVTEGRQALQRAGVTNAALEHHPLAEIQAAVRARQGEVDVFLLYAVLEHMTVAERLEVLALAREVVRQDGAIVVCETPNRLTYLDHHTAQMPFFHLLPEELAARIYSESPRAGLRSALGAAEEQGPGALREAVGRWGRGVSFHEFELVFGDLGSHVLASSYDPRLFGERPIHPEEVVLARYLDRVRPELAPAWSRQWLDVILSPRPVTHRSPFLRPWTVETTHAAGVGWTRWENLQVQGPEAVLSIRLPCPTSRIVVGTVAADAQPLVVRVTPEGAAGAGPLPAAVTVEPPHTGFTEFTLGRPAARLQLRTSASCHVVFVGYDS